MRYERNRVEPLPEVSWKALPKVLGPNQWEILEDNFLALIQGGSCWNRDITRMNRRIERSHNQSPWRQREIREESEFAESLHATVGLSESDRKTLEIRKYVNSAPLMAISEDQIAVFPVTAIYHDPDKVIADILEQAEKRGYAKLEELTTIAEDHPTLFADIANQFGLEPSATRTLAAEGMITALHIKAAI